MPHANNRHTNNKQNLRVYNRHTVCSFVFLSIQFSFLQRISCLLYSLSGLAGRSCYSDDVIQKRLFAGSRVRVTLDNCSVVSFGGLPEFSSFGGLPEVSYRSFLFRKAQRSRQKPQLSSHHRFIVFIGFLVSRKLNTNFSRLLVFARSYVLLLTGQCVPKEQFVFV